MACVSKLPTRSQGWSKLIDYPFSVSSDLYRVASRLMSASVACGGASPVHDVGNEFEYRPVHSRNTVREGQNPMCRQGLELSCDRYYTNRYTNVAV